MAIGRSEIRERAEGGQRAVRGRSEGGPKVVRDSELQRVIEVTGRSESGSQHTHKSQLNRLETVSSVRSENAIFPAATIHGGMHMSKKFEVNSRCDHRTGELSADRILASVVELSNQQRLAAT